MVTFYLTRSAPVRMLLRASIPVEAGNEGIVNGALMSVVQKFLAQHKPEAAYFYTDDNGCRCASIILDMKDASEVPGLAEPWFLTLNAKVTFRPVMTAADLAAAGAGIDRAVKEYSKS